MTSVSRAVSSTCVGTRDGVCVLCAVMDKWRQWEKDRQMRFPECVAARVWSLQDDFYSQLLVAASHGLSPCCKLRHFLSGQTPLIFSWKRAPNHSSMPPYSPCFTLHHALTVLCTRLWCVAQEKCGKNGDRVRPGAHRQGKPAALGGIPTWQLCGTPTTTRQRSPRRRTRVNAWAGSGAAGSAGCAAAIRTAGPTGTDYCTAQHSTAVHCEVCGLTVATRMRIRHQERLTMPLRPPKTFPTPETRAPTSALRPAGAPPRLGNEGGVSFADLHSASNDGDATHHTHHGEDAVNDDLLQVGHGSTPVAPFRLLGFDEDDNNGPDEGGADMLHESFASLPSSGRRSPGTAQQSANRRVSSPQDRHGTAQQSANRRVSSPQDRQGRRPMTQHEFDTQRIRKQRARARAAAQATAASSTGQPLAAPTPKRAVKRTQFGTSARFGSTPPEAGLAQLNLRDVQDQRFAAIHGPKFGTSTREDAAFVGMFDRKLMESPPPSAVVGWLKMGHAVLPTTDNQHVHASTGEETASAAADGLPRPREKFVPSAYVWTTPCLCIPGWYQPKLGVCGCVRVFVVPTQCQSTSPVRRSVGACCASRGATCPV